MLKYLKMKAFILTQILIVILLVTTIAGIYYVINLQHSKPVSDYSNSGPVTSTPASLTLNLESPDDNLLTFSQSIIISGKTLPNLNVLISSNNDDLIIQSKPDGTFSSDFELKTGVNEIIVATFGEDGEERIQQRTVYYSKDKI